MLFALNGLFGCQVAAINDGVGTVKDFLFDVQNWKLRWMVMDTGHWLPGRKVLIHPSAIVPLELPPKPALPMVSMGQTLTVLVRLTKQQIEASPEEGEDEPVTRQMQQRLYEYYGLDPLWGGLSFGADAIAPRPSGQPHPAEVAEGVAAGPPGDPRLGSVADVKGYAVHATDGDLGHVESVLADDVKWDVRYFVIATRNWLPGKLVELATFAVTGVDWVERRVNVNVTRDQVRSAPDFDPVAMADEVMQEQLRRHFGWPGFAA